MHIAYIISAYKLPEQLVRLVSRLAGEHASILIHVDKNTSEAVYGKMVAGVASLPNVQFLSRHVCHHGDFGHVRATLKGIETLVERHIPFDYAVLLTGQDYPIKSLAVIEERFRAANGMSFMDYQGQPWDMWHGRGLVRIEAWHYWIGGRHGWFPGPSPFSQRKLAALWALASRRFPIRRHFPYSMCPYGGSSYWCLAAECIAHVYQFVQDHPAFVNYFRRVHVPDEIFFQTIVMNSPHFRDTVVNDNLRYIDWAARHGSSPAILDTSDLPAILASSALFARKFDPAVDVQLLDAIDRRLYDDCIAAHA